MLLFAFRHPVGNIHRSCLLKKTINSFHIPLPLISQFLSARRARVLRLISPCLAKPRRTTNTQIIFKRPDKGGIEKSRTHPSPLRATKYLLWPFDSRFTHSALLSWVCIRSTRGGKVNKYDTAPGAAVRTSKLYPIQADVRVFNRPFLLSIFSILHVWHLRESIHPFKHLSVRRQVRRGKAPKSDSNI